MLVPYSLESNAIAHNYGQLNNFMFQLHVLLWCIVSLTSGTIDFWVTPCRQLSLVSTWLNIVPCLTAVNQHWLLSLLSKLEFFEQHPTVEINCCPAKARLIFNLNIWMVSRGWYTVQQTNVETSSVSVHKVIEWSEKKVVKSYHWFCESPIASQMSFFDSMCMNTVGFITEGSVFCVMMTSLSAVASAIFSSSAPVNTLGILIGCLNCKSLCYILVII